MTTYQALVDHAHLRQGQKVLIIGGSSGTGEILSFSSFPLSPFSGSFGVQLAKHVGATVAAVCSEKNVEFVQGLGADQVIDYTKEDWAEVLRGQEYDVVYDCVGTLLFIPSRFLTSVPPPLQVVLNRG